MSSRRNQGYHVLAQVGTIASLVKGGQSAEASILKEPCVKRSDVAGCQGCSLDRFGASRASRARLPPICRSVIPVYGAYCLTR